MIFDFLYENQFSCWNQDLIRNSEIMMRQNLKKSTIFYVFRMVPKVKITPIDTNQPEVEQNGPYDRSYLREEDTRSFFIL